MNSRRAADSLCQCADGHSLSELPAGLTKHRKVFFGCANHFTTQVWKGKKTVREQKQLISGGRAERFVYRVAPGRNTRSAVADGIERHAALDLNSEMR
jgi:hypothetical protein